MSSTSHRRESLTRSKVEFDPLSPGGGFGSQDNLDSADIHQNNHQQQHVQRSKDHSKAVVSDRKIHSDSATIPQDILDKVPQPTIKRFTMESSQPPHFEVLLEKRGRGRGISVLVQRPWATRFFRLEGQRLEYFDGATLKGTISTAGASCREISPSEADNREFPFILDVGREKVYLNAPTSEIRQTCIELLNFSSDTANWAFEY